jgi:hypothetical protein
MANTARKQIQTFSGPHLQTDQDIGRSNRTADVLALAPRADRPAQKDAFSDLLAVELLIDALADMNAKNPEEDVSLSLENGCTASFTTKGQSPEA